MTMQSTARASHCSHAACNSVWKKIKEQEGTDPARHSENLQLHCSVFLTAHLAASKESVQAVPVCTYTEKKSIMPVSPFPLLDGLHQAHLPRAPLTCSGQVAGEGQMSRNSRRVWLQTEVREAHVFTNFHHFPVPFLFCFAVTHH